MKYQSQPPFLLKLVAYSAATAVGLLAAYGFYLGFIMPVLIQVQPSGNVPVIPVLVVPNAIPTMSIGPANGHVDEPPAVAPVVEPLGNAGNTAVFNEAWAGELPVGDTTDQAARVYAADPDRAATCMHAAAGGRRVSPACREIIDAMGTGR